MESATPTQQSSSMGASWGAFLKVCGSCALFPHAEPSLGAARDTEPGQTSCILRLLTRTADLVDCIL